MRFDPLPGADMDVPNAIERRRIRRVDPEDFLQRLDGLLMLFRVLQVLGERKEDFQIAFIPLAGLAMQPDRLVVVFLLPEDISQGHQCTGVVRLQGQDLLKQGDGLSAPSGHGCEHTIGIVRLDALFALALPAAAPVENQRAYLANPYQQGHSQGPEGHANEHKRNRRNFCG